MMVSDDGEVMVMVMVSDGERRLIRSLCVILNLGYWGQIMLTQYISMYLGP